jgi:hypothetical protein
MALQKKINSAAFNQSTGEFVVNVSLFSTSSGSPVIIPDFAEISLAIPGTPSLAQIKSYVDTWAGKVEAFQEAKADASFTAAWGN